MTNLMSLEQGSEEWLRWRMEGIGSSDAAAIMGASPWRTIHELYLIKTGAMKEAESNDAMRRGTNLEPIARVAYQLETGIAVTPAVGYHPDEPYLRASADGLSADGTVLVEIKCPGRSDHLMAREGQIPEKYYPQVMHLLNVFGAKRLDYVSFDGENIAIVPLEPDAAYIEGLLAKERAFWWCVVNRTPPEPAVYEGKAEVADADMVALAYEYMALKDIEGRIESVKRRLQANCAAEVNTIGPLTITRTKGRMSLDTKALEKAGIDLTPYRKRGEPGWKITMGGESNGHD